MEIEELIEVSLETDDTTIITKLKASEIEEISADSNKYLTLFKKLEKEQEQANTKNLLEYDEKIEQQSSLGFRWTTESIKLLLDLRLGMEGKFNNPTCKKSKFWDQISKQMLEVGQYLISGTDCNGKYRNLLQTYRQNKEKRLKTTGESKITLEFFEIFDQVLGNKASTVPPDDILSSSISPTLKKTDESDDILSEDSVKENTKKRLEYKKLNEISIGHYLHYKKETDKQNRIENRALKEKEIQAINNLANAIRATAGGSRLPKKLEKKIIRIRFRLVVGYYR